MSRRLFCEIHPITYKISKFKGIMFRKIKWFINRKSYVHIYSRNRLPIKLYKHNSLIRRKLGNVDMQLQENKAVNLKLTTPKINGILIRPGEIFSFWRLVGNCTEKKGYKEGLIIKSDKTSKGVAGGMCQFTNLIHWMILHSPLTITEHHHHNHKDLFPDYGRQVPFGTGTSIMYNYKDYQFRNNTDYTFQLITYTDDKYLKGELLCDSSLPNSYHIEERDHYFSEENGTYYRHNKIYKVVIDKISGNKIKEQLLKENKSMVMYDPKHIPIDKVKFSS